MLFTAMKNILNLTISILKFGGIFGVRLLIFFRSFVID